MNRIEADAHEALLAYEARHRRHAAGYAPQPRSPIGSTWSPRMSEQEQQEFHQYVIDNNLPF